MKKKIVGVLVDVNNNVVNVTRIEYDTNDNDYLDVYYKVLNCDTFDIVTRRIGSSHYSIYCDDEGLFKEDNKPSAITFDGARVVEVLVGNLFVCKHNDDGETISLTDKEMDEIFEYVHSLKFGGLNENRNVLLLGL